MTIDITDEKLKQLTPTERQVIEYINHNEEKILQMSITDIAETSFTSSPTVSRAIKKCGFKGISELRYKISADLESIPEGKIVNQIFEKSMMECRKTLEILKPETILEVIRYMKRAKKIYIVAGGTTAWILRDFEFQLQLLGYNAYLLSDIGVMEKADKLFTDNDLIMIFTIKNSIPELSICAENAKKMGAKVVVCCCRTKTILEQFADVSVFGYDQRQKTIEEFDVVSRLPLEIVVKTLEDYLILSRKQMKRR